MVESSGRSEELPLDPFFAWIESSAPFLVDCIFEENVAERGGGGIYCRSGAVEMLDCIVRP